MKKRKRNGGNRRWILLLAVLIACSGCSQAAGRVTDLDEIPAALADTMAWYNASYAAVVQVKGGDPLAMRSFGEEDVEMLREELARHWNVDGPEMMEERVRDLQRGHHNAAFQEDNFNKRFLLMSEEELEAHMDGDEIYDDEYERLWLYYMRAVHEKYGENAMMGWDLASANYVAHIGYLAGYCTLAECLTWTKASSLKLQEIFSSWDEMMESYLACTMYWTASVIEDEEDDSHPYAQSYETLKALSDGPYSVPWDTKLA